MKYMLIDTNGFPEAFYDDSIHTSIPTGAISISENQWEELVSNPHTKRWDGSNVVDGTYVDFNPTPIEEIKAMALVAIDTAAGEARSRYITSVVGQEMTYQEKAEEAADYISAGYPAPVGDPPTLDNYPFLQAEVEATGKTHAQAADDIIAQRTAWIGIGATIEKLRISGKTQTGNATTLGEIETILNNTIVALNAV